MEWLFNYIFSWEIFHYRWTVPKWNCKFSINMFTMTSSQSSLKETLGPNLILTLISPLLLLWIRSSKSGYFTVKLMHIKGRVQKKKKVGIFPLRAWGGGEPSDSGSFSHFFLFIFKHGLNHPEMQKEFDHPLVNSG